jgi:hypothetical protein
MYCLLLLLLIHAAAVLCLAAVVSWVVPGDMPTVLVPQLFFSA